MDIREHRGISRNVRGFSLVELLIVLAVVGVVLAIAALNLRPLGAPLDQAANGLAGSLRQARTKAMATTSAYRVRPTSPTRVITERANRCGADTDAWTNVPGMTFELEGNIVLAADDWEVCFTNRGMARANSGGDSVEVAHASDSSRTRNVTTLLAGGVRVGNQ